MGAGLTAALAALDRVLEGRLEGLAENIAAEGDEAELLERIGVLLRQVDEARAFVLQLSKGVLTALPGRTRNVFVEPLKELRANLAHLTWQAARVAEGDYAQRVDFLGDLGEAFNRMVSALAEKDHELRRTIEQLKSSSDDLRRLATIDVLTGSFNRRYFLERAADEIERARRYERPLCLCMLDIDHFKDVNDRWGHPAGDAVLTEVTNVCQRALRSQDVFGRVGGEEFGALLPETVGAVSARVAERLRAQIAASSVVFAGQSISVTVSIGVAGLRFERDSLTELIQRADNALYRSKQEGRDRVTLDMT
jgi:diguanylate cyclase (GGDEF)-like protein